MGRARIAGLIVMLLGMALTAACSVMTCLLARGSLNEGVTAGSASDVAFAAGVPAMLIGALIWRAGARLRRSAAGARVPRS
jgi:hypothetical protein